MANVYTTVGKQKVVDYIDGTAVIPTYYVHWGTGAGTAAVGDTTLFTAAAESRVATSQSQPAADTNQFQGTITSSSGQTITNAGIFDASTSGNLLLKSDFTGIALLTGDSIQFTFTLQQT
jgi:hypothetical protein